MFADVGATDYNPHFLCVNSSGASMKSASFIFDRRLYELLQEPGRTTFTIRELRDAYAARSLSVIRRPPLGIILACEIP